MELSEKIEFLEKHLLRPEENYADSFKADIIMYFDDNFSSSNPQFIFLNELASEEAITDWIENLLSQFVMKFDADFESEGDFIFGYLNDNRKKEK